jgi:ABC-2 type transport system permease protein
MVWISVWVFSPVYIMHFWVIVFYSISACLLLSLLGMLSGIIADSFDQMAAITSYIITPLAFLSGTFYSVNNLPVFWYYVTHANPFFYMIDGFRYGMTGYTDGSMAFGAAFITVSNIVLWIAAYMTLKRGYKIKT